MADPPEGFARILAGNRLVPALSGTGLMQSQGPSGETRLVPDWVAYVAWSLHDVGCAEADRERVVRELRASEDLRAAVSSAWLLAKEAGKPFGGREAVRGVLAALGMPALVRVHGEPETEAELAADAVARLRSLGGPRRSWGAGGHVVTMTRREVQEADEVRCVDCDAVLKNRRGPSEQALRCGGPGA